MAIKYRSVPTVVEAMQWTGQNISELWDWVGADNLYGPLPEEGRWRAQPAHLYVAANDAWLDIKVGDWVIHDSLGFYPCDEEIFAAKYEEVDDA